MLLLPLRLFANKYCNLMDANVEADESGNGDDELNNIRFPNATRCRVKYATGKNN